MSKIHWSSQVSADFNMSADWSSKTVPGATDDAILDASGSTAYTVTASTNETVNSIQTASTATLSITGGTFTAAAGTGTGGNAGFIIVGDATTFAIGGTFANSGTVTIASAGSGNPTVLAISKSTTLNGAGKVTLTDFSFNQISGGASATTLTNVDNTLSGAGTIGSSTLTLVNKTAGTIDATGNNALILNTGTNTITNAGTLEATGFELIIDSTVANAGGVILAQDGATVDLQGATIIGGTLNALLDSTISAASGGATFDGTTSAVTNEGQGTFVVIDSQTLNLKGSIVNSGTITVDSAGSGNPTVLAIAKNTTLSGGGKVTLTDFSFNQIAGVASATTLTNVDNTLSGSGTIGSSNLTLVNQLAGIIDATGNTALVLNTGTNTITNAGLIEATGAGGLTIDSTIANAGASILAGNGSSVSVVSATIIGGTLKAAGTGDFFSSGATFDGTTSAVTSQGVVNINDGLNLSLEGSIVNSGTIAINSAGSGNPTVLAIAKSTTLSGGGKVTLTDFPYNQINGGASATTLTNVDNAISGSGTIGSSTLTLVNQTAGIIDATGNNALILNTGTNTVSNAGLIESTGAGGLTIDSAIANTANLKALGSGALTVQNAVVTNTGGVVTDANGGHVSLQGGTINGGTLTVASGGLLSADSGTSVLAPGIFTNAGAVSINDGASLGVSGSIANSGTITINSAGSGNPTALDIANNTTLGGAGKLILTDFPYNQVVGGASATTLTNVNNTISGSGTIGSSTLTLVNQSAGIIDATGNNALVLNTATNTITNGGLLEATGVGGLTIDSTVANTGGSILAGNGSNVALEGMTIIGGTVKVAGSGTFTAFGATFDGTTSAVTNQGLVNINDSQALSLEGSIVNSGTITVDSAGSGNPTVLAIAKNTTLSGGGKVTLTDFSFNQIAGVASATTLTNVDNTLSGSGTIGSSNLTLVNQLAGIIDATGNTALVLNTGTNTITNAGLIEATGAGGLTIDSTIANAGASILAGNGSSVSVVSATIIGGTLKAAGTGDFFSSGATFDGTTSAVTSQGVVNINDGLNLSLEGSIVNSGTIAINSAGSGNPTVLAIAKSTTLSGGGKVTLTDFPYNQINGGASATTLTNVDNAISGSGTIGSSTLTLVNQTAGIIDATGNNALILNTGTNTVSNAGLIESTGAGGLTIDSAIANAGTLLAHVGTLAVVGALTNVSGTTLTGGTYEADAAATLELPQNTKIVTDKATIILNGSKSVIEAFNTTSSTEVSVDSTLTTIASSGTLEILGGRNWTMKATMSNAGTLQLGGGTFAAGSLSNTGTVTGFGAITAPITNSGTMSVQANKTLSLVGGSLSNLTGTTLTGGTYVVGAGGTLQLANNLSIATLNATIDLAGVGASLQSFNTGTSSEVTLESSLTTIGASGALKVLGGRGYTTANAIGNSGLIQLGGGTFTSGALTDGAGSSLTGFGTVGSVFSDAGGDAVTSSGGALGFTGTGDTFATALSGTEIDFAGGTDLLQSGSSLTAATVGVSGGAAVTLATSQTYAGKLTEGAGTVNLGGNTLTLTGSGSTLAGAVNGAGSLAFVGGTQVLNSGATIGATTWSISGGAAVTVNGALTYGGTFTEGAGTSLTVGKAGALTLTGTSTFAGSAGGTATLALSGGTAAFNAGASVSVGTLSIASGAVATLNASLTDSGALAQASGTTIAVGANTLTLTGSGSTVAGSVSGTGGTLAFAGGTQAVNAGAALTVSNWSLTGGTTTLNTALTYKGAFSEGAGSTLTLTTADNLTLTGAAALSGTVNGAALLKVSNATVTGLVIGGTASLEDTGTVDQTGTVTVGDATTKAAHLTINAGATYLIENDAGVALGHATTSNIKNSGTLTNSGSGTTVVAVKVVDTGTMAAAVGVLDFTQAITGAGSMLVAGGATLELDSTVASTLSMTFESATGVLALKDPSKFAATINGFAPGDTIDLLGKTATSAMLGTGDTLVITNGSKAVATLQLAGNYSGDTFTATSDGHGGTNITVSTGAAIAHPAAPADDVAPAHRFIAAMAGIGGGAGGLVSSVAETVHIVHPMLMAPRIQAA
jgi:hypothetical protein